MINQAFQLSSYSLNIPDHLAAQEPLAERSASRLLVSRKDGSVEHHSFIELSELLPRDSLVVMNNSKVFPARILSKLPSGGVLEIFLLRLLSQTERSSKWLAIGRPMKRLRVGFECELSPTLHLKTSPAPDGSDQSFTAEFNQNFVQVVNWLETNGIIPLPPYIQRKAPLAAPLSQDRDRYQNVYAQHNGSVAAPTAGLHFTREIFEKLKSSNIEIANVTLHVGGGTFLPMKTENISEHPMHYESFCLGASTLSSVLRAKADGRAIFCVGTTSLRALESFWIKHAGDTPSMKAGADSWHETNLFIRPERDFEKYTTKCGVDGIITNFHQPMSTLIVLVCALAGYERTKAAYAEAVANQYRFYSYGDSSLFFL